jgi:DNA-binding beta-propeller fold protein YncE
MEKKSMITKYRNTVALAVLAVSAGAAANAQTYTKTITLPVSTTSAEQIAVNPFTNKIYVAVTNFGTKPYDYLTEIDGATDKIIKTVEIPPIGYAIAVDAGNGEVYVGGTDVNNNNKVVVFNGTTLAKITSILISTTPGFGIQGLAVNALAHDVYVANGSDDEIDVINCGLKKRISTGDNIPFGVAVNPVLNTVYTSELDGNVSVIDGKTKTLVSTSTIGSSEGSIAVNILTGDVLTPNAVYQNHSTTGVLNAAGSLLVNVSVGNTPIGIAIDPISGLAFVANTEDGTVSRIIDNGASSTNATPATFPISALFLAVNPVTRKVYASSATSEPTVTVFSEN